MIYRFQSAARAEDPPVRDKTKNWGGGQPFRWCQIDVLLFSTAPDETATSCVGDCS